MTVKILKDQMVDIFKQAEGKRFTYFQITTKFGIFSQPVIEGLKIHHIGDTVIHLADEIYNVSQVVHLPLKRIDYIEEIIPEKYEIMDSEAEYNITYDDGTTVYVMIYNQMN